MDKDKINISTVETFLNSLLYGTVSDNTFFGRTLDASVISASDWQDMVVVEIPNGISDRDAYGKGTALVWLYARPQASGRKNVEVMSRLEKKLNTVIKTASGNGYLVSKRLTYTSYNTEINWHCNVMELQLTIV